MSSHAGRKFAYRRFLDAKKNSPAYRAFLAKKMRSRKAVFSEGEFESIPVMDKHSFINAYPPTMHFSKDDIPPMLYASSGSSGKQTFWYSNDLFESYGGDIHEHIFREVLGIQKKDRTLVVVCFSFGLWIAGMYTFAAVRELSRRGWGITTATPGLEIGNIVHVISDFAPLYKKVVIAGYPPFLTSVLGILHKKNILPKDLYILTAGDKFTEKWRSEMLKYFSYAKNNTRRIMNIYGTADAGPLGFETSFTIAIRRAASTNKTLKEALFSESDILPGVFQYDSHRVYMEVTTSSELLITPTSPLPLIRYNLHDVVSLYTKSQVASILEDSNEKKLAKLARGESARYPFIIVKTRTDVAVVYFALNIYPENISIGISKFKGRYLTGSFLMYVRERGKGKERLYIDVELSKKKVSVSDASKIRSHIILLLEKNNSEFSKIVKTFGPDVHPQIEFFSEGTLKEVRKGVKTISLTIGKKPKIVL